MPQNTFIFVSILAVIAALVVGVNVGRTFSRTEEAIVPVALHPTPMATPTPMPMTYSNSYCGISFQIPKSFLILDTASGSAVLSNPADGRDSIIILCQSGIPRPPLSDDKIESITIASVSARLYHDASAKDGTPIDKLIFRHPVKRMDVLLSGFSSTFQHLIQSLSILE